MLQIVRFFVLVVGFAAFALSGPSFAQRAQGYVQEVSGNVTAQVGTGQPARVEKGQTLVNNATITTAPQSFAVLKFEDGTAVVLKENTSFQIQNYAYNAKAPENANAIFNLVRGGLRMITGLVTSRNRDALKIATPLATIGIRGTEFTAELVNPLWLGVQVGAITATNAGGTLVVSAGQFGSVVAAAQVGSIVGAGQVPAGVLQMPNVPLTPVPTTVPPGTPVGAGVAGGAVGPAVAIGAAAVAGVAAAGNETTTVQH
jgi:hypothetical protein